MAKPMCGSALTYGRVVVTKYFAMPQFYIKLIMITNGDG
jgi:hypothetical protein